MSLSIQPSCSAKSLPYPEKAGSDNSDNKVKITEAKILFLGKNYTEGFQFGEYSKPLIEKGILSKNRVQIHLAEVNDYKYAESGFDFVNLHGPVLDDASNFSMNPMSNDCKVSLIKSATTYATEWAKAQGFKFNSVVPLNMIYRNEDPVVEKCRRPVKLTHIDFDPTHLQKTLLGGDKVFKPHFEIIFGEMSTEEYQRLCSKIKITFNLWISFNEIPVRNKLCLVDKRSINPSDLIPIRTDTDSLSVRFKPNLKWVTCKGMSFGIGAFVDTQWTLHAAAEVREQEDCDDDYYRESAEIRFALINLDPTEVVGSDPL